MTFALGPRARSSGYRLEAFQTIESTNVEALARIRAGERGPLWLASDHQTAGRGRRQRAWSSPPGNLAATVIETLNVKSQVAATLGFAAGLALDDALKKVSLESMMRASGSTKFQLKWPNDVLADGKKLAGILLEAESTRDEVSLAVGMGVNIVTSPDNTPYPATSLHALGINVSAGDLFMALSDAWAEYRGIWNDGRGFADIRAKWLDVAAGIGAPVSIQSEGHTVEGVFETLDDDGRMMIAKSDGKRVAIAVGDVYFGAVRSTGAA